MRSSGSSLRRECASASDARVRFLAPDRGCEAEFDFERRESREGDELEDAKEAERLRTSAGIEQRRDSCLSLQAGRFLVR